MFVIRLVFMPSTGLPTGKTGSQGRSTWAAFWLILLGVVMIAGGAFLVYKYRIRVSSSAFSHFGGVIGCLMLNFCSIRAC